MYSYFKNKSVWVCLFLAFFSFRCLSQEINVNKVTGTANITIPLYTIVSGNISWPISLNYQATGVRPTDGEGSAGMGWNFNGSGAVTRTVEGLPDDIQTDLDGNRRLGWLNNTNQSKISSLELLNDNNTATWGDSQNDINSIMLAFADTSDTEPDIFHVNVPGLSFDMVFDQSVQKFRTTSYQDVVINFTKTSGRITSFTITDDKGLTYTFADVEVARMRAINDGTPTPSYFRVPYNQLVHEIEYNSSWNLTRVSDLNNNSILFTYTSGAKQGSTNNLYLFENASSSIIADYTISAFNTEDVLTQISYSDGNGTPTVAFNLSYIGSNTWNGRSVVTDMTGSGRDFEFGHAHDMSQRLFLTYISDPQCNSPFNYTFNYNNRLILGADSTLQDPGIEGSLLPDSTTNQLDYWGFYNGNTIIEPSHVPAIEMNLTNSGYDRYRNMQSVAASTSIYPYSVPGSRRIANANSSIGSLTLIGFGDGGTIKFTYEPNDYYDNVTSSTVQGSGIRISKIEKDDGSGSNIITTNYTYTDPATGLSSGKPVSLPVFAFTKPFTGTGSTEGIWDASTVVSPADLSKNDHTILYSSVKESRTGSGSVVSQFIIPAAYNDNSAPEGFPAWSPVIINTGAYNSTATGFLVNDKNTYPFVPNPNYSFERGLLSKVINYNDNNNEVSETAYTYQTPQAPVVITGFKYDYNTASSLNFENYAKYQIYTSTAPLMVQLTEKTFDLPLLTTFKQNTYSYYYGSTAHRNMTEISSTNSDGSMLNSYFKYVKDYTITTPADHMTSALQYLQNNNANTLIEQYNQVVRGSAINTISGKLNMYDIYTPTTGNNLYLQSQSISLAKLSGGVQNFQPSGISSGSFVKDVNYTNVDQNNLAYDYAGNLLSKDDNFKHVKTLLTDHISDLPVAIIDNANYNEIAFNDFDSKLQDGIGFTGATTLTTTSRTGVNALSLSSDVTMSKTLVRNVLASNYIFSLWIKATTSGQITVNISGTSVQKNIAFTSTAGTTTGWQYYQTSLPLAGITTPNLTLTFSSSASIIVDDILSYPDIATVNTFAYDPATHFKTAETNTNGISSYYSVDNFGRLLFKYDKDKNIVLRNQYISKWQQFLATEPIMVFPEVATAGQPTVLVTVDQSCTMPGATYTWNFGDGSPPVTTSSSISPVHTYQNGNNNDLNLTASVTVSSPLYGTLTGTGIVAVKNQWAKLYFYNSTNGTFIQRVDFVQGGSVVYSIPGGTLIQNDMNVFDNSGVAPGTYTVNIYTSGHLYDPSTNLGFSSVHINGAELCLPYSSTNLLSFTYTFVSSPTMSMRFDMLHQSCGPPQ